MWEEPLILVSVFPGGLLLEDLPLLTPLPVIARVVGRPGIGIGEALVGRADLVEEVRVPGDVVVRVVPLRQESIDTLDGLAIRGGTELECLVVIDPGLFRHGGSSRYRS